MQIYVNRNGQQSGPYEGNIVLDKLRNAEFSPNDLGIRQGETVWRSLGEIFPQILVAEPGPPADVAVKKGGCLKGGLIGAGILILLLGLIIAIGSRFMPSPSCDRVEADRDEIEKLQREIDKIRSGSNNEGLGEKLLRLKSMQAGYETSYEYCEKDRFRDNLMGGAGALAALVGFLMAVVGLFVGRKK